MSRTPNILMLMADQMAAFALPPYGHRQTIAPTIAGLGRRGVVFDAAYSPFPLCAPARFAMMTGRLASAIGAYDNAAEFPAAAPTVAHRLRRLGYRTAAAGKLHFVGPDQLHGFEERLTTDIYPADFGWTPDWSAGEEHLEWHHSLVNVVEAGPCARSLQIDFDDEVAFWSERWLYDRARDDDGRPFFLLVSFSHPHDPYTISGPYWDRYEGVAIDPPRLAPVPLEQRDPHSRRLWANYDGGRHAVSAAHVANARRAYLGMISYVDDRIAALLAALEATGEAERTVIVLTSDHGDMLGERGMWYKMSFFEPSLRVPLIVAAPGRFAPRRVAAPVSLYDLAPTLLALAGGAPEDGDEGFEGIDLLPALAGATIPRRTILAEYLAEATTAPLVMLRDERYKAILGAEDPPLLFDLARDPDERENLAGDVAHAPVLAAFEAEARARWDFAALDAAVRASQKRRRLVFEALMTGARTLWDYAPPRDPQRAYIRNLGPLYGTEARARLPRRPAAEREGE